MVKIIIEKADGSKRKIINLKIKKITLVKSIKKVRTKILNKIKKLKENREIKKKERVEKRKKYEEWKKGTYVDERGYLRYNYGNRLVHRDIAFKEIYLNNRERYLGKFSKYHVHHRDENKLNNDVSNLQILTPNFHKNLHESRNFRKVQKYNKELEESWKKS